jgi:hypothetical protein
MAFFVNNNNNGPETYSFFVICAWKSKRIKTIESNEKYEKEVNLWQNILLLWEILIFKIKNIMEEPWKGLTEGI